MKQDQAISVFKNWWIPGIFCWFQTIFFASVHFEINVSNILCKQQQPEALDYCG